MAAELTVIVVAGGRHDHLRRVLTSLAPSADDIEVIVVDLIGDGRVHDVVAASSASFRDRHQLTCQPTVGGSLRIGAGRNLGAAAATGRRLCFLDVDCLATPDAVARWCRAIDGRPEALSLPPVRYLAPDWNVSVDLDSPVGTTPWRDTSVAASRPTPGSDRDATEDEFDLFWSLAFLCTLATFERTGGFDEDYVGYGAEDTDLARRARSAGIPMVWLADPPVFHQHHPPTRLVAGATADLVANACRFHARWGDWPMTGWLDELSERGLVDWQPARDLLRVVDTATVSA